MWWLLFLIPAAILPIFLTLFNDKKHDEAEDENTRMGGY